MLLVTAAEMRELDRLTIESGTAGWTLMQRAGQGATEALLDFLPKHRRKRIVIVCGKGNNGGDGFVIACELKKAGALPEVFLLAKEEQVQGDAALALRAWKRLRGKIRGIDSADDVAVLQQRLSGAVCAVDAIFGTGLTGPVSGIAADVITLLSSSGIPIFAVDIPSGLHADLGVPLGTAIQAEMTATFGFPKIGQVLHPGVEHCGVLAVVDIGLADIAVEKVNAAGLLLDRAEVAMLVPRRSASAHKGDAGHVLVIAGSRGKTGAAVLCARAAGRAGAGLVTAALPASQQAIAANALLEAMSASLPDRDGEVEFDVGALEALLRGKSAVVCGPGLGTGEGARVVVDWLVGNWHGPLVLDADALNIVAAARGELLRRAVGKAILTPHPGEMARLCGRSTAEVQADRVAIARAYAVEHNCILVLKGARTVIAAADGRFAVNPTGNPGMASGGMGDVLAGITGALLAQGLDAFEAACLAVHLHGHSADRAAAERGEIGLLAGDVIEGLPAALRDLANV